MVGYWIDGKPIYQKIVSGNVGTTDTIISNLVSLNLDYLQFRGVIKQDGSGPYVPIPYYTNANDMCIIWVYDNILYGKSSTTGMVYVTLQYTKTTDTPI